MLFRSDRIQARLKELREIVEKSGYPDPERTMRSHIPIWTIADPNVYHDTSFTQNFALHLICSLHRWINAETLKRLEFIMKCLIRDHEYLSQLVVPEQYRH